MKRKYAKNLSDNDEMSFLLINTLIPKRDSNHGRKTNDEIATVSRASPLPRHSLDL